MCELRSVNHLLKNYCEYCREISVCTHEFANVSKCKMYRCKRKNTFHYHIVCEKCFSGNYKLNKNMVAQRKVIFRDPVIIYSN